MIILSDSQGRGLSTYLLHSTNDKTSLINYCRPAAPLYLLTESIKKSEELEKLTKKDFVVLIGGTNDISGKTVKNTDEFLTSRQQYINEQQILYAHTNLVLSTIPYRYDLSSTSLENQLIKKTNFVIRKFTYDFSF